MSTPESRPGPCTGRTVRRWTRARPGSSRRRWCRTAISPAKDRSRHISSRCRGSYREDKMTPQIGSAASQLVIQRLTGQSGANSNLAALTQGLPPLPGLDPAQIRTGNISADLAEQSAALKYPCANVYCEKIVNSQKEKFRTFSGTVQMAIDLRHSEDRVERVQSNLELYADSLMGVLDASSGDW